jgi:hypothetical protein
VNIKWQGEANTTINSFITSKPISKRKNSKKFPNEKMEQLPQVLFALVKQALF